MENRREFLEQLVDDYRESLMLFIYRYVKNLETAEDLAEDVFVELLIHPDRYDPSKKASVKTYLYTIGRNKAIDYIRKNARLTFVDFREAGGGTGIAGSRTLKAGGAENGSSGVESAGAGEICAAEALQDLRTLEDVVIRKDELRRLYEAMADLKEEYRTALYLTYFAEMSYRDAGNVMGKTEKQIENLIYRAKKALRSKLGGVDFER